MLRPEASRKLLILAILAGSAQAAIPTATTLVSSANPTAYGQPVTLTASVSPSSAEGYVAFYDGVTILETIPLVNGQAILTISLLASGVRSLKAQYVSAPLGYASSFSSLLSQTVVNVPASGFSPAVNGRTGPSNLSQFVVSADLNGDGYADLVTSNLADQNVSVLLGNGDGTFKPAVNYSTGLQTIGVAIGDFNGDGIPDIVVTNNAGLVNGSVSVLLGNGDGTFQIPMNFPVGLTPAFVAVGDFNLDGIADLAVANSGSNTVSVLLGIGDGTFQPAATYNVGSTPASIAVTDLNNDGFADLVIANTNSGSVSVMLGAGNGAFHAAVNTSVGANPASLAVGDFNADGDADVAVSTSSGVVILLGGGNGDFLSIVNDPAGAGAAVAVADFNGDGNLDLAVDDFSGPTQPSSNVNVLLGNGNGTFQAPITYPTGGAALAITAGEFNGDGAPDLAVLDGGVSVLNTHAACVSVATTSIALDANGGLPQLTITTTSPSCAWTLITYASWIQPSVTAGTGNATVTLTLLPNTTGADLSGSILIGTQVVFVTERFTVQVYTDVPPSAYYFDAVNLMAAKDITSGCAALMYCPAEQVTRAQMAVFIVRAIMGGDDFPYTQQPYFTDVPVGSFGFPWIQKLRDLGITSGCSPTLYCPDDSVTRAQMAVFIIRMRYGASTQFDYPPIPYFTDVPVDGFGFAWIQRMKEDTITAGCSYTTYCPNNSVTRGDMAVFIMRGGFNAMLPSTEPILTSVSPASLSNLTTGTITVTGLNTNFVQGTTVVNAVSGISVGAVNVTSPTTLTVSISANTAVTPEPVSIWVSTGTQEAVIPNGLTIQ
jgi:hypothetical protein